MRQHDVFLMVVAVVVMTHTANAVSFSGVFDSSTFSASASSQAQLGDSLRQYFKWGDDPIFSLFQGSAGVAADTISILFAFGSTDPTANQLQMSYSADVQNYLTGNSNATLLRGALLNSGILMYSITIVDSTPQPTTAPDGSESPLKEYLPAIIVGGVVLLVIVVGAIVFVVMKRRSALDDRLFDTMEAMMDEDSERATRGVEGIQHQQAQQSKGGKLPAPTASRAAPPPQQSV